MELAYRSQSVLFTVSCLSSIGCLSRQPMSNQTSAGFDEFAGKYEAALQQGLSATGESKDYFAQGRIQYLERHLVRLVKACADSGFRLRYGNISAPSARSTGAAMVTGVDVSEESLKVAARDHAAAGNAAFATFQQLPPAGNMDLAFCNGVFHHIPLPEARGLDEIYFRLVASRRHLCLLGKQSGNPGTRYVMSRIPFDRDAVTLSPPESRRLAKSAGFDVLVTRFVFFFPKSLGWLRWMELRDGPHSTWWPVYCIVPQAGR